MDILDPCSELLSNRQVLNFLKTSHLSAGVRKQTNLATVAYETISYLESTPAASSTLKSISGFLESLREKRYELTKIEKIQISNLCPQNETELGLIVDNLEERLSEEQRAELLVLIQTIHSDQIEIKEEELVKKKIRM